MTLYGFTNSYRLFERAREIVPNGIYGPRSPYFLTFGSYPCFIKRGKGSRIWDVDGNEYIDYMCSFGTNIVGICNEEVDAAARDQMERGDCFTLPTDRWNELAEHMVGLISGFDWVAFGKNGSDVTSYATAVARGYTGRNKIIVARGAYHGSHAWCSPNPYGIPAAYREHVLEFEYNNLEQFRKLVEQHRGDVAGVMLTPYHHPALADQQMPAEGFYAELQRICRAEGIIFIMDDIRCGFRPHLRGSHCYFGADPDLICFGKAMANGYPISALMGKRYLQEAAARVFFTGTYFFSAVPMAATLACLRIIERDNVVEKVRRLGELLKKGIEEQAREFGLPVNYTGHPAMPFMTFQGDKDFFINRFFCGEAAKRGVFLHPHHNWFLSAAHTAADIERTLEVTRECFALTARQFFA